MLHEKYQKVNCVVEYVHKGFIVEKSDRALNCARYSDAVSFAHHAGLIAEIIAVHPITGEPVPCWRLRFNPEFTYRKIDQNGKHVTLEK